MDLLRAVFRRGWRTSEFWTAAAAVGLVLWLRGDRWSQLLVAAIAFAYIAGRAFVKGRAARHVLDAVQRTNDPPGPRRV